MRHSRTADKPKLAIVVAAAGESRRFGSDKMAATIGRRTVLERSIDGLREAIPEVPMVVVVASDRVGPWRAVLEPQYLRLDVIAGGSRRQDSVRLGVKKAVDRGAEIVAIHDGARPLIHIDDARRTVAALGDADAAILVTEISDTVKRVDAQGFVVDTIDRDSLRSAQTPQVFRTSSLKAAWTVQDSVVEFSDEAMLLESVGRKIRCVNAEHPNPKLTTAGDLALAQILAGEES